MGRYFQTCRFTRINSQEGNRTYQGTFRHSRPYQNCIHHHSRRRTSIQCRWWIQSQKHHQKSIRNYEEKRMVGQNRSFGRILKIVWGTQERFGSNLRSFWIIQIIRWHHQNGIWKMEQHWSRPQEKTWTTFVKSKRKVDLGSMDYGNVIMGHPSRRYCINLKMFSTRQFILINRCTRLKGHKGCRAHSLWHN